MISFRARLIRFVTRQMFKRVRPDSNIQSLRWIFEKSQTINRMAPGVAMREVTIQGIACEWLIPESCEDAPVLYYLHGGIYLMGSPATHRKMVSHIAREAGVRALLPDYSLAPEHPFPAGLKDCVAVYQSLLASGIGMADIIIAGDSAGGGMCVATLLSLRAAHEGLPAAAVLMSPWLDLTAQGESAITRAKKDPWFRADDMRAIAQRYHPDGDLTDSLVSPVFADAAGLPPILIQVGDHEILLSDSIRLAEKISAAGGQITLQVWPDMWHVFQFFIGQMPEAARAIRDMAGFIRKMTGINSPGGQAK